MMEVVGEYVRDYGFSLPNPVSIHREYPNEHIRLMGEATASDRVEYADTSTKNEATWYRVLGH